MKADVWTIPGKRRVIVRLFDVPFVLEPPEGAGENLGTFEAPMFGWGRAGEVARAKAAELNYLVEFEDEML